MTVETAFTQFPMITTPRLRLREIVPADAPALLNLFSDPEVVVFGSTPLFTALTDAEAYIQRGKTGYEMHQFLRWGVTLATDDVVIGTCSFHHFGPGFHCVETGYNLHRAHWGKGIVREAMTAVVAFGFTDLACHRIEAVIDEANVRSRRLIARLGFTYEGSLRQRYPVKDRFEDENYYALLRPEWLAKQAATS